MGMIRFNGKSTLQAIKKLLHCVTYSFTVKIVTVTANISTNRAPDKMYFDDNSQSRRGNRDNFGTFLAGLDEVQEEVLYYPRRWRRR